MTRTSATGPERRRGFTLVELLLVLTVISLAATAVVLAAPDQRVSLTREAERLAARLALARDAAILQSRPFAVAIDADGYAFSERRGGAWEALSRAPFQPISWEEDTRAEASDGAARIVFDPTGFTEPAQVRLVRDGRGVAVAIDAAGEVRVSADASAG